MGLNLPQQRVFTGQPPLWKRFVAFVADFFILDTVIGMPFQRVVPQLGFGWGETLAFLESQPQVMLTLSLVTLAYGLLAVLYFSLFEYFLGSTPGKMLFGIFVEAQERRFSLYLVRNLSFLLVFPFFILLLADAVSVLVRKDSRRICEIFSRTATVQYYAL